MKIAFLIDTIACDTAGTQKQLLETIRRLNRTEFQPELICLWESPWMTHNALPCHCTVLGYRGFLKSDFPSVVRRLAQLISNRGIDIIQTFFEDSIFVGALGAIFARRRPILLSSRRDIGLGKENQPWYHELFGYALPVVNRQFTGIVANSEQVRAYVSRREKTSLAKIKVHYNGVSLPDLERRGAPPSSMSSHDAGVWIGIVASLTPVKRHDLIIRAFAEARTTMPQMNARLLLLGEGPQRAELERLAQACGVWEAVQFEGAVTNVDSYLRHLDIGVLCSDREGLSNAILEYMAYGLPVVATDVGGNSELVNASNGILVPPNDVSALAQALSTLVGDKGLRARLGHASRDKAHRSFSWENSMRDLEDYYRTLLANRDAQITADMSAGNSPNPR
jgi:glycosyltransferase involved in cell wall biosynthesis